MEVSVIIPVYNAVGFLDQSIQSALDQPEVREVITIDDGSTDGSYEKLVDWERKEERVKLFTHPGRERKRAGAARNLGLKAAQYEYIAFLDADDYFLPDRFRWTKETLSRYPEANVVFEAVEIRKGEGSPMDVPVDNIVMMENVLENKLFEYCLTTKKGHISPDGLTFKRKLLEKTGLMDESLSQKQDRDFILKLSLHGIFKRGIGGRTPITVYRYHKSNTVKNRLEGNRSLFQLHEKWIKRIQNRPISFWGKMVFLRQYMVGFYSSHNWPKIKKIAFYPFLYTVTLLRNIKLFYS